MQPPWVVASSSSSPSFITLPSLLLHHHHHHLYSFPPSSNPNASFTLLAHPTRRRRRRRRRWPSMIFRRIPRRKHETLAGSSSSSSHEEEDKNVGGEGSQSLADRVRKWIGSNQNQQPVGERVVRMLAGATASPTAQFIASPTTVFHSLDPRVKQAWLLALVVLPSRSPMAFRVSIAVCLALATMAALPEQIWKDQLGRMLLLSGLLFVMLAFGTDGVAPLVQTRTPPPALESLPRNPKSLGGYSYVIMKFGPFQLTRKGLSLATTASCLSFTVLQSASLCLTTTTPEQLSAALRWYLFPLSYVGAPVDEIILTLLLSLRFVSLVFDEVRNLSLSVVSRRVQWNEMKFFETLDLFAVLMGRFFKNLLYHAEQIAQAMVVRGFKGDASKHRLYLLTTLKLKGEDVLAIAALAILIAVSVIFEMHLT